MSLSPSFEKQNFFKSKIKEAKWSPHLDFEGHLIHISFFSPRPVLAFGFCCCLHLSMSPCVCVSTSSVSPQLAMRRRATSSRRWHQSPRSRSHTQRRADVGSRSQAAQSATLTLQRGLGQWTQSVLASSLDRRQGDPRQMAEIRKLRVNLQLLKSK